MTRVGHVKTQNHVVDLRTIFFNYLIHCTKFRSPPKMKSIRYWWRKRSLLSPFFEYSSWAIINKQKCKWIHFNFWQILIFSCFLLVNASYRSSRFVKYFLVQLFSSKKNRKNRIFGFISDKDEDREEETGCGLDDLVDEKKVRVPPRYFSLWKKGKLEVWFTGSLSSFK